MKRRPELGWIGQALGAVRDLDVQLDQLDGWLELVPEADRAALEALRWLLEEERASARVDMLDALDARRYEILVQIGRTLRARQPSRSPEAARPALEVVFDLVEASSDSNLRPDVSGQMRSPATTIGCASAASAFATRSSWSATSTPGRHVLKRLVALQDLFGLQDADVRHRAPAPAGGQAK